MAGTLLQPDELQRLERVRFVELFGGVFEHAPIRTSPAAPPSPAS